jgi:hypothetical protein
VVLAHIPVMAAAMVESEPQSVMTTMAVMVAQVGIQATVALVEHFLMLAVLDPAAEVVAALEMVMALAAGAAAPAYLDRGAMVQVV